MDTDSHSYLLFSSSHPNLSKQSIPYFQFLRLRRLCSDDKDFEIKSLETKTFSISRDIISRNFQILKNKNDSDTG